MAQETAQAMREVIARAMALVMAFLPVAAWARHI
jgi:hypothetical protein